MATSRHQAKRGGVQRILVEGASARCAAELMGRTNATIAVSFPPSAAGQMVVTMIDDATGAMTIPLRGCRIDRHLAAEKRAIKLR